MDFEKIKGIVLRRYQAFVPMMLVSSLLLVGYAAIDKEAPVIETDLITLNYGEELDLGKIQIKDNQTSLEELDIQYDLSTLDETTVGSSYITVQATDLSNNVSSKIVEVRVVDQEKPTYELIEGTGARMEDGVLVINLNASNQITDYIKAVDNADGDVSAYITVNGAIDTNAPAKQAINLVVSDSSGNTNDKTFDVEVKDMEAPVITFKYGDTIEIPYGCEFVLSDYVTATDNSGDLQVFNTTEPVDTTLAEHTYEIAATDYTGYDTRANLTVVTKDNQAPAITVESSYTITAGDAFDINSKVTVEDNKDETVTPVITGTVDPNTAGTYTVTITATDEAGNEASQNVTVTVNPKPVAAAVTAAATQRNATTVSGGNPSATVSAGGVVGTAASKVGSSYAYGGTGPYAFDCSGFAQYVYAQNGKSIPRTTYAQYAAGQKVSYSNLQPGDLVFFNCHNSACSHVAIYAGNGMVVHAATASTGVCYTSMSNMLSSASLYGIVRY